MNHSLTFSLPSKPATQERYGRHCFNLTSKVLDVPENSQFKNPGSPKLSVLRSLVPVLIFLTSTLSITQHCLLLKGQGEKMAAIIMKWFVILGDVACHQRVF